MNTNANAELPRPIAWFALMALGLAVLVVVAMLRGDPQDVPWYVVHVLPLVTVAAAAATPWGGKVTTTIAVMYAIALPVLAWAVGFGLLDPWDEPARLQLFTDNPNLLAADLVAVFWAGALVRPRGRWVWLLPLVAVAVVLTGSRTALFALAGGTAAWLLVPSTTPRVRAGLIAACLLVSGFLAFANHQLLQDAAGANLLFQSTTFDDHAWQVYDGSVVEVSRGAAEGPWSGTRADRIIARSGDSRLTLYQSFGRSELGTEYVASVYLRADAPQTVVVSNHLARTPCAVTNAWIRCVSPIGVGDGRSATQFRLETLEPGQAFDVFAFGPQYELGIEPNAYDPRGGGLLSSVIARRLTAPPVPLDGLALVRDTHVQRAWSAFTSAPWFGYGIGWERNMPPVDGADATAHAHNLLAERLATDGIAGMIAWLLIACAVVYPAIQAFGWRAGPWLVALVALNTWDATWFHSGSYFSTAIVAGVAIGRIAYVDRDSITSQP